MICFSPHPEYTRGLESFVHRAVRLVGGRYPSIMDSRAMRLLNSYPKPTPYGRGPTEVLPIRRGNRFYECISSPSRESPKGQEGEARARLAEYVPGEVGVQLSCGDHPKVSKKALYGKLRRKIGEIIRSLSRKPQRCPNLLKLTHCYTEFPL